MQMPLNTHTKINTTLSGRVVRLEHGYAQVVLETTEAMSADETGLVHGGFVFSAADFAAMAAVNEPNVVLASSTLRFLAPVRSGEAVLFEAVDQDKTGRKRTVTVSGSVGETKVFEGEFKTVVTDRHVLAVR